MGKVIPFHRKVKIELTPKMTVIFQEIVDEFEKAIRESVERGIAKGQIKATDPKPTKPKGAA